MRAGFLSLRLRAVSQLVSLQYIYSQKIIKIKLHFYLNTTFDILYTLYLNIRATHLLSAVSLLIHEKY